MLTFFISKLQKHIVGLSLNLEFFVSIQFCKSYVMSLYKFVIPHKGGIFKVLRERMDENLELI